MAELSIRKRLNKALIKKGVITEPNLKKALEIQKLRGGKLSDILVKHGYVDKKLLMSVISEELGVPPIDLSRYKIEPALIKLIPKKIAKHYQIVPISKIGNLLTIAMADPLNILATDDVQNLTGLKIGVIIATDKDIKETLDQYYGEDAHQAIEKIIDDIEESKRIHMVEEETEDLDSATLIRLTQEAPIVKITNLLLAEAVKYKASDILIEPMETELRVRYRVDGILEDGRHPPKAMHQAIVSRLKVMSDLNIAEHRLPQDGRFKLKIEEHEVDFRISVLPSSLGEKVALRILDKSQAMLDVGKLGFEKSPLKDLKKAALAPHGMILVCGPTGCGKTTTLYSILKHVDSVEKNLVTVEDPVEYQLVGINQVTIIPDIGLTFASSLRSILRQDPDIIMVGEIRDFDTVDIAIKAALTGHLVLSTLHTTTACGSIVRLINMGVEPFLISSSIILIAAQRLIRKICPMCKTSYKLTDARKKELNIASKKELIFYEGKGCNKCNNTGYKGRIGLMEALYLSPKVKDLIAAKAKESEIKTQARKDGMKTLRENGVDKALAGVTTLEEVVRVTIADKDINA